jgi:hypothetical protein
VPVYVQDMLFSDRSKELTVLGVPVKVFAYEPVVWVSLTAADVIALPPDAPRFPALVDTGNVVALNIREGHLSAWTKPPLGAGDLPFAAPPRPVHDASGQVTRLPRNRARVWLHPYPEGAGRPPLDLEVSGGILDYEPPPSVPQGQLPGPVGPHLPLLGALAFRPRGLSVHVNYRRLRVFIGDEESPAPVPGSWLSMLWHSLRPRRHT